MWNVLFLLEILVFALILVYIVSLSAHIAQIYVSLLLEKLIDLLLLEAKEQTRDVSIAGQSIRCIRAISKADHTTYKSNRWSQREFDTEDMFLQSIEDAHVKFDRIEVECDVFTRIYKPSEHMKVLGIGMPTTPRPVKKALVHLPFNLRIDETERLNRCAGPRGDFFVAVGGHITTSDVVTIHPRWWKSLQIEWADGTTSIFRRDDILTTPGKRYPDVEPFEPIATLPTVMPKKKTRLLPARLPFGQWKGQTRRVLKMFCDE